MRVVWKKEAKQALLEKTKYIADTSKNKTTAKKFYNEIVDMTKKLEWLAQHFVDNGKMKNYPLKNGHRVKFFVMNEVVYIAEFLPKGMNKK